ncbi:Septum formation protein Maf [Thalassocella blandensis]|nr:Septum formation protein Maf [Thalassocella blandensis]
MSNSVHLQLASKSPRRREILQQLGVRFSVVSVDVPEKQDLGESPAEYVQRLASSKALAGYEKFPGIPTLGADTIVCCDEAVLEKPKDEEDFLSMMRRLSGRQHQVLTAVSLCNGSKQKTHLSQTDVSFRTISEAQMLAYWQTGEPQDKAGGYAIQGKGAVFVTHLQGSYSGVVGLPIEVLNTLLTEFDVPVWSL